MRPRAADPRRARQRPRPRRHPKFRHLVRSLVDEGRTVLLSSHLLDEVEKTCDIVAAPAVRATHILAAAPAVHRAVEHDGGIRATLAPGAPRDADVVTALLTRLIAEGVAVERVNPVKRSLEDQFLSMTTRLENA